MRTGRDEIGMIGVGVMGRNMLLNTADHGFPVAGYDKDSSQVEALQKEAAANDIHAVVKIQDFIGLLRRPRDYDAGPRRPARGFRDRRSVPSPRKGDLIIDVGNSYFKDTNLRARNLTGEGTQFLGVSVSDGEDGARHGPSIMPGGPKEAYARVRPLLEAVAARVNRDPCVAYLGPGSAGHFVKTVHNGIQYVLMQLLAETFDLMKRGLGLRDDQIRDVYDAWNQGKLNGYLVEITIRHWDVDFAKRDGTASAHSHKRSRGRDAELSVFEKPREPAGEIFIRPIPPFAGDRKTFLDQLGNALHAAMIIVYAQGMPVLAASDKYAYHLDFDAVARIWRGGCIIGAALLEDIRMAYCSQPGLSNLILAPELAKKVMANEEDLCRVAWAAIAMGLPTPCFMTALAYFDGYRSAWLPANLIQAQRDSFGAHGYMRVDVKGTFHTDWTKD